MRNHNANNNNNNNNKIMTISMPCKAPPPEGLYRNGVHTHALLPAAAPMDGTLFMDETQLNRHKVL